VGHSSLDRSFSANVAARDGLTILSLAGEMDLSAGEVFETAMRSLDDLQPQAVILDLTQVRFLDGSGLRLLLELSSWASRSVQRLDVVGAPPWVRRVLDLTGHERFLEGVLPERLRTLTTPAGWPADDDPLPPIGP
jgi:anti-sigma B factor antagonist